MKQALYMGQKNIKLTNVPIPKCGDNDVLLKNIYAGICGTDVAVYNHGPNTGHRITVGGEFGHEMVSKVVEVGKNITDISVGDRVYPYPLYVKDDTGRAGTAGGFSEYILSINAKLNKSMYLVPDEITDIEACLVEPFTVGTRAARRSIPKNNENAIVFGCGTIGLSSAIALKHFGCKEVMIVDISDFRLNIAEQLGFVTCNSLKDNIKEKAEKVFSFSYNTKGKVPNVDIYIDACGDDNIIPMYQEIGKIGSRLVVVAVNSGMKEVNILDMTFSQHSIIGSGGYMPEDVVDVFEIMKSKKWNIENIVTDIYDWENLPKAIEKASNSNLSFNVMIKY